jgi:hypothetical protein
MLDYDALIAHWTRMPDEQFTYFATHEAADVNPEAVDILRQELRRRGTVRDADAAIDVQRRQLTSDEFQRMITRFRSEPCPLCGASGIPLNGTAVYRGRIPDLVVGCRPCLEKALANADILVSGAPHLIALDAVIDNAASRAALGRGGQTEALRLYVWQNRGEFAHFLKE